VCRTAHPEDHQRAWRAILGELPALRKPVGAPNILRVVALELKARPVEVSVADVHTIAVVIPVYRGERTLEAVVKELVPQTEVQLTAGGYPYRIDEVVLVHDRGDDRSDTVIRSLMNEHTFVRPVWLSRNFGQHPATLAGMTSTGSDWIVTMDEDGQHDARFIPMMLDRAMEEQRPLVYAAPSNKPPHGTFRNASSRLAKWLFVHVLAEGDAAAFNSFRLVLGEHGRSVAAYCGPGVFLDVALGWITGDATTCPVEMRHEGDRPSGYSMSSLMSHFWRLVVTSGTRPLRLAAILGLLMAAFGFLLAVGLVIGRALNLITVEGWTSVMVVLLLGIGLILVTLGVIAEYVGSAVKMAMGRPLYLVVSDPAESPLGRTIPPVE
jgi:glycosyltransferase involved in cell wall biosynthesis